MDENYFKADRAALTAYGRAHNGGAVHVLALNVAVSVWFCQCPWVDARWARRRISRLLDAQAQRTVA